MKVSIETVQPEDYEAVKQIVNQAYANEPKAYGDEAETMERIRATAKYNPSFEVEAKIRESATIVGYAMLMPVVLHHGYDEMDLVALTPLAVLPEYQGQGIAEALVHELTTRAQLAGVPAMSAVGDANYLSRFNFVPADTFNVRNSLEINMADNLIKPLKDGALLHKGGVIRYPNGFFK
ncbi:GNAT family N-acetyltransferase [Levilactobacillus bambusae]|uniref:N-acetyltransferase n=1 Tax=Levilactobacillus bambusae TaxID=2024736 RepID=A0A2V1MZ91_9LACO|nr:N-acetyltransferase [Levilactobacillus bambusae]PWF99807.1 N-acetyltransferase [Levilactobacillus bambusae]